MLTLFSLPSQRCANVVGANRSIQLLAINDDDRGEDDEEDNEAEIIEDAVEAVDAAVVGEVVIEAGENVKDDGLEASPLAPLLSFIFVVVTEVCG